MSLREWAAWCLGTVAVAALIIWAFSPSPQGPVARAFEAMQARDR